MKKVVLVTGASRGIGRATALLFAREGYDVAVNYKKNAQKAEEVVSEIKKMGRKALAIKADISNEEDVIKLFNDCETHFGKISVLVNNGGTSAANTTIEDITFTELDNMFKVNCYSAFLCSKRAIQHMKEKGGAIINVSSEAAKFGGNNMAHYAAAKAGVNILTVALAREVAKYKIRVNAVSPGVVDTDAHLNITEDRREHLNATMPMGRMAKPEEVADVIFYLASDKASYVSGSIVGVTGGR